MGLSHIQRKTASLAGRNGGSSLPTTREYGPGPDGPTWSISGGFERRRTPRGPRRTQKHRGSGHGGVAGGMPSRAAWCDSPEPDGVPGQRGPAGRPAPIPGVDPGQRAAAQAGAPPGGAQSPALTQLKAGMAAPPFGRPLRSHSPAEVIMAAPCTRPPVHSQSGLRSVSVNSGPTGSAAPPHCPGALLSQSPARAAGSLLAQDPDRR